MRVISDYPAENYTVYLTTVKLLAYISKQLRIYLLHKNIRNLFLGVNIFNLYVTICDENPEVMILDRDVLHSRSNLQINRECDRPLIVFDCMFENTAQYLRGVSLKLEY